MNSYGRVGEAGANRSPAMQASMEPVNARFDCKCLSISSFAVALILLIVGILAIAKPGGLHGIGNNWGKVMTGVAIILGSIPLLNLRGSPKREEDNREHSSSPIPVNPLDEEEIGSSLVITRVTQNEEREVRRRSESNDLPAGLVQGFTGVLTQRAMRGIQTRGAQERADIQRDSAAKIAAIEADGAAAKAKIEAQTEVYRKKLEQRTAAHQQQTAKILAKQRAEDQKRIDEAQKRADDATQKLAQIETSHAALKAATKAEVTKSEDSAAGGCDPLDDELDLLLSQVRSRERKRKEGVFAHTKNSGRRVPIRARTTAEKNKESFMTSATATIGAKVHSGERADESSQKLVETALKIKALLIEGKKYETKKEKDTVSSAAKLFVQSSEETKQFVLKLFTTEEKKIIFPIFSMALKTNSIFHGMIGKEASGLTAEELLAEKTWAKKLDEMLT